MHAVCITAAPRHHGDVHTSVTAPYSCYLRVYEPLAAFDPIDRQAWRSYVEERGPVDRDELAVAEQEAALLSAIGPGWLPAMPRDRARHAYVLRTDDGPRICPVDASLRSWLALADLLDNGPDRLVELLLPAETRARIRVDLMRWRARNPDPVVHIRTATWRVPTVWFVAFHPAEREIGTGTYRTLRYRTPMVEARRRLNRAYNSLRRCLPKGRALAKVVELGRWLESFHPHAVVELDYGGLVHLLDVDELDADTSVERTAATFAALAEGDVERARKLHAELEARWAGLAATQSAS